MTQLREHQKPEHPEEIRRLLRIRRDCILVKENQLREFMTQSGVLVQRLEPNRLIKGTVLMNCSKLTEVKPGQTLWFRRECGTPFLPRKGKPAQDRWKPYVLIRAEHADAIGDAEVIAMSDD